MAKEVYGRVGAARGRTLFREASTRVGEAGCASVAAYNKVVYVANVLRFCQAHDEVPLEP
jgi:hypothetical protein